MNMFTMSWLQLQPRLHALNCSPYQYCNVFHQFLVTRRQTKLGPIGIVCWHFHKRLLYRMPSDRLNCRCIAAQVSLAMIQLDSFWAIGPAGNNWIWCQHHRPGAGMLFSRSNTALRWRPSWKMR